VIPGRSGFGPFPDGRSLLSRTREHLQRSDGATIEIARFRPDRGPSDRERGWHDRYWHYDHESQTRAAFERIFSDRLGGLCEAHSKSLMITYTGRIWGRPECGSPRLVDLYGDRDEWNRRPSHRGGPGDAFRATARSPGYAGISWGSETVTVTTRAENSSIYHIPGLTGKPAREKCG